MAIHVHPLAVEVESVGTCQTCKWLFSSEPVLTHIERHLDANKDHVVVVENQVSSTYAMHVEGHTICPPE